MRAYGRACCGWTCWLVISVFSYRAVPRNWRLSASACGHRVLARPAGAALQSTHSEAKGSERDKFFIANVRRTHKSAVYAYTGRRDMVATIPTIIFCPTALHWRDRRLTWKGRLWMYAGRLGILNGTTCAVPSLGFAFTI